jgi:prefoldin subunit 5
MYRDSGAPFIQTQDQTVKQLQNKIDDLQTQLEEARQGGGGRTHLSIDDLVTRVLDQQYQSLDELIERVSASDDVAQHLQRQIENRLYALAENGKVEFQRGHGWRLKEGN